MRIIGGEGRGRRLRAPKGFVTRPTTDRVREAVFNILGSKIVNAVFLDLFCGSGAIAIEAVSRGASAVVAVEKDRLAVEAIKANTISAGYLDKITIYKSDAFVVLDKLASENVRKFDIIYLDPPYYEGLAQQAIITILNKQLLAPNGLIVMESSKKEVVAEVDYDGLIVLKVKSYGDTCIKLYQVQ